MTIVHYTLLKTQFCYCLRIHSLGVEYELPMFPSTLMLVVRVRVSVDANLISLFVASASQTSLSGEVEFLES
jgi:hypothetical protein